MGTSHKKIMVLKSGDYWDGKSDQEEYRAWLFKAIEELDALARKYDGCGIRVKIKEIVPEYDLQDSECVL